MPYLGPPPLKNEGEKIDHPYVSEPEERDFREPMTVGRLMDILRSFPSERRVLVRGYEYGYDDPREVKTISAVINSWGGGVIGDYDDAKDDPASFVAVLIDR